MNLIIETLRLIFKSISDDLRGKQTLLDPWDYKKILGRDLKTFKVNKNMIILLYKQKIEKIYIDCPIIPKDIHYTDFIRQE